MKNLNLVFLAALLATPLSSYAWGRRGHSLVAETAAYLVSTEPGSAAIKNHSYDLGYYANAPDFFWKKPATYEMEKPQHFMDMEIFDRAFVSKPEIKDPLALSRKEFEAAFPDVKPMAGRAYWRIREMNDQLDKVTLQLRALKEPTGKERQALQEKWIVLAGTMAHYVGDLGMPLHVSENYDGEKTGQKGIHGFFEDTCVDEVYPRLVEKVHKRAQGGWAGFQKANKNATILAMLKDLTARSKKQIDPLLKIDKRNKRDNLKATCPKFEAMFVQQLADSALVLAEIYRRDLGWNFDDNRFYFLAGEPEFIKPGEPEPVPGPTTVKK